MVPTTTRGHPVRRSRVRSGGTITWRAEPLDDARDEGTCGWTARGFFGMWRGQERALRDVYRAEHDGAVLLVDVADRNDAQVKAAATTTAEECATAPAADLRRDHRDGNDGLRRELDGLTEDGPGVPAVLDRFRNVARDGFEVHDEV